ncbi:hypothetical protein BJ165DRAFT_1518532 [Panaeolus papilionaceus]|nr:hypothetical protein BJ165DRAFT_1518532 [Panaeolus papilionaceus]
MNRQWRVLKVYTLPFPHPCFRFPCKPGLFSHHSAMIASHGMSTVPTFSLDVLGISCLNSAHSSHNK